jgi:CotH kinase protein/Lamin Tail Domain/Chitobiase/beta-hexosaminidase C-terminal domain/Secretion system C-terminal sorting domain
MNSRAKIIIILLLMSVLINAQSIIINELMSSNYSFLADEDGDYPDWIEIYNPNDTSINLFNYSLADNNESLTEWYFPSTILSPKSYLLIFASGKNRINNYFHTDFKLKSSGEKIWLRDSFGYVLDSVVAISIPTDYSVGRNPEDFFNWQFFEDPTPGTQNSEKGYSAFAREPEFSLKSGFYPSSIKLNFFSTDEQSKIYYTSDGSTPNQNSIIFTKEITIDSTSVIKAICIRDDLLPSPIVTNTFFINENSTLPVISISTDPKNLWDDEIGIYTDGTNGIIKFGSTEPKNYNQPWERPAFLELFEANGVSELSAGIGIKIHGAWSRQFPQKSFEIFAEPHYGSKSIDYKLFPNRNFDKYDAFLLRNSGQDNQSTLIRDATMQSLVENIDIETQAYRPALVYLNGTFWGIYNIRERVNKHYFAQHKGVDPDAIDVLKFDHNVVKGSSAHYDKMYTYIKINDISIDTNYSYIKTQMDIKNYITYMLAEMFYVNFDWYPNNMKYWRPQTLDGKWRWVLKDTDYGFGLGSYELQVIGDMFTLVTDTTRYPSVVFNGLLENSNFRKDFINKFADYSNTIFHSDNVVARIKEFKEKIDPEMPKHIAKWAGNYNEWNENISVMNDFSKNRIPHMQKHFIDKFNLNSIYNLTIRTNIKESIKVKLNSLIIKNFPWNGTYFSKNPIDVEAVTKFGYSFVGWSIDDSLVYKERKIELSLINDIDITAMYKADSLLLDKIIINEINYNSSEMFDTKDWIEIVNISTTGVNISGWQFSDKNDQNGFVIPQNTTISQNSYIVFSEDSLFFSQKHPNTNRLLGNFDFKISNEGEKLKIFDKNRFIIDSVEYGIVYPWPTEANGTGFTLELSALGLENSIAENWHSSTDIGGTPGKKNSQNNSTGIVRDENSLLPNDYEVFQNYPNPFNPITTIKYGIPINKNKGTQKVKLIIYDILGREVEKVVNTIQKPGYYEVRFDASDLTSGIYFYKFLVDGINEVRKMILLK